MIKGVLFDFDGVTVNSMQQHLTAWKQAFGKFGYEIDDLEFLLMEGRGVDALAEDMAVIHDIDPAIVPEIIKEKIKIYEKHLNIEFYNDYFNLLNYLKFRKIKMALVTGGSKDRIYKVVNKYFTDYFSAVITSDDVKNTKPYPEPYLKGLETLGLKNTECIVVENAPLGIESGKAAGMYTIAIETTLGKEYLQKADIIVQSFSDLQQKIEEIIDNNQIALHSI